MDPTLNANQAADQTAYPYPAGVMPPEHEQTDTTGSTTTAGSNTESKALSPVQVEAEAGQDKVAKDQIAATGEQRAQKERENAIAADMARRTELAGQGYANEYEKASAESNAAIDKQRARASVAQQRYDNQPPIQLFHEGDTWGNVLRGFGLALGAVGDAKIMNAAVRAGHAPPTLDTVGNIISSDLDKQKQELARKKDAVVMAQTGIKDAIEARQQAAQDIELRGAHMYAQLERVGRARLAAMGMSQPEIDQHQAILAIQEKRAEQHAKYVEPLYNTISQHLETAKRKDEAVTNRTNAAAALKAQEGQMAAPPLAEAFKTVAGYQPGALESVTPYAVKGAEGQKVDQANAILKTHVIGDLVSKKAVANPEAADKIWKDNYEIRPSDAPEVRAAKLRSLHQVLDQTTMGGVSRSLGAPAGGAPAPPAAAPVPAAAPPPAPRPAAPASAPAAPALDRPTLLRALSAKLQEARAKGDPRAAAIEARIREVVRGG